MSDIRSVGRLVCAIWAAALGALALIGAFEFQLSGLPAFLLVTLAAVLGSSGAWISYDPKAVLAAVKRSWYETTYWKPNRHRAKLAAYATIACVSVCSTPLGLFAFPVWPHLAASSGTLLIGLMGITVTFYCSVYSTVRQEEVTAEEFSKLRKITMYGNPVGLLYLLICFLFSLLYWVAITLPRWPSGVLRAAHGAARFSRLVFIRLNCSERRARASGTALGILAGCAIGYPLGSVLLGSLLCGAIGFAASIVSFRYAAAHEAEIARPSEDSAGVLL